VTQVLSTLLELSVELMHLAALLLLIRYLSERAAEEYMQFLSVFHEQRRMLLPVVAFAVNACWLHMEAWTTKLFAYEFFAVLNLVISIMFLMTLKSSFDKMFASAFPMVEGFDIRETSLPTIVIFINLLLPAIMRQLFL
jgi:hypothetical protein